MKSFVKNSTQQFQSECSLTGKTASQVDNQSALIIHKGRFQLYSSKSYANNLVNTYLYSFNQSVL